MNKFIKLLSVLLFFLSSGICALAVNDIVIFGDSLSDTGNNGRYSDGGLWLEFLAKKLNLSIPQSSRAGGLNFAYSGAMSGYEDSSETVNVGNQIKHYLEINEGKADPEALYIIWVGGNDFLDKRSPLDLIDNISNHIETLANAGARRFFIPNLPSLAHAPKGEEMIKEAVKLSMEYIHESFEPIVSFFVNNFVCGSIYIYNMLLEKRLQSIEFSRNIAIHHLDVFSKFNNVISELKLHGFSSKSELFYDPLHPSSKGHELIANWASEVLKANL